MQLDFGIMQLNEDFGGNPIKGVNLVYRHSPKTKKLTCLDTPTVKASNKLVSAPIKKLYATDTDVAHGLINHYLRDMHTNHPVDVYDDNQINQ